MKLSLNLPTLERLIGGDTEIELELRYKIAEEFCKRRLKGLVNDYTASKVAASYEEEYRKLIDTTIKEFVAGKQLQSENCTPDSYFALTVRRSYEAVALKVVEPVVLEKVKQLEPTFSRLIQKRFEDMLDAAIAKRVKEVVDTVIAKGLKDQVEVLVQAEVQRRLLLATQVALNPPTETKETK